MRVPEQILVRREEHKAWRRDLHAHPEIAFQERYTSDFVARRLEEFGLEVHRGLAGTGVVGTLRTEGAERAIALRADMDALPIQERTGLPYASQNSGVMHACGHDGHTTMLLAAAQHLAQTRSFRGAVHFIFQPAEENEGGGRVMVEQGLFRDFPCERVFGMHNWPGLEVGRFALRPGPIMAAFDVFEIVVRGRGAHAAKPQQAVDPIVAAAHVVAALQTVVSRSVDPIDAAVVSVTQFHAGEAWNVIPESALLRGTARSFRAEVQDALEGGIRRVCQGTARALGAEVEVRYERRYPPTVNDAAAVEESAAAAADVVGAANVDRNPSPSMGAEDFSFMLQKKPGCYIWAGNGPTDGERFLHNPHYDFNDDILPVGAAYWVRLVERVLE